MARPGRLLGLTLLLAAACAAAPAAPVWPPADPLSVRYRDRLSRQRASQAALASVPAAAAPAQPVAAIWSYRTLVAPALGARCRMFPSDSEYVDRAVQSCGGLSATVRGVARTLLEVGATAALLPATVQGGRLHFVDLPPAPGECGR